jgi:uncharacterized protein
MQPSLFNLRVSLPARDEVFLMNTLTDAQLLVSPDVAALIDGVEERDEFNEEERGALALLEENGFLVRDRESERHALDDYFRRVKGSTGELNVTILTTLQCNFACDYCYQGDHGDSSKFNEKMSLETAAQVGDWIERELDRVRPDRLRLMFFGGEPLLNLPVLYSLSERMRAATERRRVPMLINIVTNGLLLSEEVVDRLLPLGLAGVKITLDGDRDTHNRMRPLRGGQGTFDRIIDNIRKVADRCPISLGGNFDERSVDSYPALLDFLAGEEFASRLVKVKFKPIIRAPEAQPGRGTFALTPVSADGTPLKPLHGTCMTAAGAGSAPPCDSCQFLDEKTIAIREATERHGFFAGDGVHVGPCHVHMDHAHTIGPDGSLYPCPGFTGDKARSTGHIDDRQERRRLAARAEFDRLSPWKDCGECAFIPVCAGGCVVASHTTLGDMNKPTCHKALLESAVVALAQQAPSAH